MRVTKVQQHLWGQACGADLCLLLLLFRFRWDSLGGDQTVEPKGHFHFWTLVNVLETQTPLRLG